MSLRVADLAHGHEHMAIPLISDASSPAYDLPSFTYTAKNVLAGGEPLDDRLQDSGGCDCRGCDIASGDCIWSV